MITVDTPLGNLEVVVVFEFYDFPILFSCKNDTDQIFVANWVETNAEYDSWLFCPISSRRHAELLKGSLDYYSVFRGSETNHLMLMRITKENTLHSFDWLESENISDDLLPDKGEGVEIESIDVPRDQLMPASEKIVSRAIEFQHTVGHIHFRERTTLQNSASTVLVGRGLVELQSILDAVGQSTSGEKSKFRGSIPRATKDRTHTYVTAFNPGSLAVEIVATDTPTLFDNSLTVDSFYKTTQIIAESSEYTRLQAIMPQMGPRVAARYKKFLSTLKEFHADVEFEFSGAGGIVGGSSVITYEQAVVAFENISKIEEEISERITISGQLIGIDRNSSSFTFRDDSMKVYSGKFSELEGEFVAGAIIDAIYRARMTNVLEVDVISGKEISRWVLDGLELISRPT